MAHLKSDHDLAEDNMDKIPYSVDCPNIGINQETRYFHTPIFYGHAPFLYGHAPFYYGHALFTKARKFSELDINKHLHLHQIGCQPYRATGLFSEMNLGSFKWILKLS